MLSVIIPAFNAESYLRAAIDSVLAQDWPNLEVLVVDNHSTDTTASIIKSYKHPVYYLYSEMPGQPPTTNTGIRNAKGDWLAFIDADDIWAPNKLKRQFREFEIDPTLDAVFGHAVNFFGSPQNVVANQNSEMRAPLPGTLLIRRDAFFRVGFYNEAYTIGSIIDWYLRAQELSISMRILPEVFLYRRIHDNNLGIRLKVKQSDYVHILKAAIDRKRANVTPKDDSSLFKDEHSVSKLIK